MSLQRAVTIVFAVLSATVLVPTVCLIVFTSRMSDTATRIVAAIESVRAAEELQLQLSRYSRESFLFEATGSTTHSENQRRLAEELNQWLTVSGRFIGSPEEAELLGKAEDAINDYMREGRSEVSVPKQPLQAYRSTHEKSVAAFDAADELSRYNLDRAYALQRDARLQDQLANGLAVAACVVFAAVIGSSWLGIRTWLYIPVKDLYRAIQDYTAGNFQKAPERGPTEIARIGAAFNDLSNRLNEQREAQLRFLASVAHDLRNPLGAIKMSSDVLKEEANLSQEDKPVVEIISRQAEHLHRMVGDLLDATRVQAGNLEIQKSRQHLNFLVQDAVVLHRSLSPVHRLTFSPPATEIFADCDPMRIGQVLNNLLNNAIKYSPNGGEIKVELAVIDARKAAICISDQGIGIPEADQLSIFEPFRRTKLTKMSIPGVGLGLSVTKKIVEAHGGRIELKSQPERGSTFRVELPICGIGLHKAQGRPERQQLWS